MTIMKLKSYICKSCKNISNFKINYNIPKVHSIIDIEMDDPDSAKIICPYCNRKTDHIIVDKTCARSTAALMRFGIKVFKVKAGSSKLYDNPAYLPGDPLEKRAKGEIEYPIYRIDNWVKSLVTFGRQRKDIEKEYQIFKEIINIFMIHNFDVSFYASDYFLLLKMDSIDEYDDMVSRYESLVISFNESTIEKHKKNFLNQTDITVSDLNVFIKGYFESAIEMISDELEHLIDKESSYIRKVSTLDSYTNDIMKHIDTGYKGDNNYDSNDDE